MIYAIEINPTNFPPARIENIGVLINVILPLTALVAGLILLVISLMAIFNYLTQGDNPEVVKKTQKTLTLGLLGLFLVIISFLLVSLINRLLGIRFF